jgi:hypothetical protein
MFRNQHRYAASTLLASNHVLIIIFIAIIYGKMLAAAAMAYLCS